MRLPWWFWFCFSPSKQASLTCNTPQRHDFISLMYWVCNCTPSYFSSCRIYRFNGHSFLLPFFTFLPKFCTVKGNNLSLSIRLNIKESLTCHPFSSAFLCYSASICHEMKRYYWILFLWFHPLSPERMQWSLLFLSPTFPCAQIKLESSWECFFILSFHSVNSKALFLLLFLPAQLKFSKKIFSGERKNIAWLFIPKKLERLFMFLIRTFPTHEHHSPVSLFVRSTTTQVWTSLTSIYNDNH